MPKKLPKTLSTSKIFRGGKGTPKNKTSAKGKPEPDVKKQTPPKRNKKQKVCVEQVLMVFKDR